ncbi:MAG: GntR family transcriptional regulator [Oscillospiraceae bacterium]|nr:GntR family transcriptional regulator [Oscillospiraceae bacterium]MBR0450612.1 GntR family transcriptional regulator [Oscillospiraceae bacterium]
MQLLINNRNGVPIYDQIYGQIKDQIINGSLKEDDPLPSIRSLAKDLKISVITTKRAYEELEAEGFIYTVPGKGSYVAPKNTDLLREQNLRKIEDHLSEVVKLSASCALDKKTIIEMVELMWEE